ncbi:hypothetical protein MTO96_018101 [Rhipicephalus appendiculatus]
MRRTRRGSASCEAVSAYRRNFASSSLSALRHGHYRAERLVIPSIPGGIEAVDGGFLLRSPRTRELGPLAGSKQRATFLVHTPRKGDWRRRVRLAKGPAEGKAARCFPAHRGGFGSKFDLAPGFFPKKARCDRVGPVGVIRGLSRRRLAAVRVRGGRWVSAHLVAAVVGYCTRASAGGPSKPRDGSSVQNARPIGTVETYWLDDALALDLIH